MAKKKKKKTNPNQQNQKKQVAKQSAAVGAKDTRSDDYLWNMSHAPAIDDNMNGGQLIPAVFFTACVILIVRMHSYYRDMSAYYWSSGEEDIVDFFSYFKMIAIVVCAVAAVIFLLYRVFTQSLAIKRSKLYIPIIVYVVFVLLSYLFSDSKDIAWLGWNDRFEGTLILMCYMFMLFYIINTVNSERNIKWMLYPVAVVSGILSILGVTQALDHDFFRTAFGQKLLVPNQTMQDGGTAWQMIDQYAAEGKQLLSFTFKNKEIYQTVYNINYVSFYLTLLIPIFGLLFIREKHIVKKSIWGVLFALNIFNLIGSASSGGFLGMFVVVVLAAIVLNKRLIEWWKPICVILVITVAVGGITFERWSPELKGAINSVLNIKTTETASKSPGAGSSDETDTSATEAATEDENNVASEDGLEATGQEATTPDSATTSSTSTAVNAEPTTVAGDSGHHIDYFKTGKDYFEFSIDGKTKGKVSFDEELNMTVTDDKGESIAVTQDEKTGEVKLNDDKYKDIALVPSQSEEGDMLIAFTLKGEERQWPFVIGGKSVKFQNDLGNKVSLTNIEHWGFKDNPSFGSGRGYIWSRSLPLLKETFFIGKGADTYCVYFPQNDYVGKYNSDWNVNMIVDKPHNMYIGIAVNTGVISLLALFALFGMYAVQSFLLYRREKYDSFASFAGVGIFLGVCGFLVSGFVNDSTVSVMPLFYGLLGTGIATNMMLKRKNKNALQNHTQA